MGLIGRWEKEERKKEGTYDQNDMVRECVGYERGVDAEQI
jgi:hypothetical protein